MDQQHPSATLDGILNIDKPEGWTSHDVVAWVRRTLHQRSVGHAGTLDPLATGVLLVCVGQATRVAEYLTEGEKVYRATARLGITTDTYDRDGQELDHRSVPSLAQADLDHALLAFTGEISQVPPAYSAIKQGGVAAYRRARRGEAVVLASRPVTIYEIRVREWRSPELVLDVRCSPGTYIRSLVHDLGQALGCGAHLTGLVRLQSGSFSLEDAVGLEQLAAAASAGEAARYLYPIQTALGRLAQVTVGEEETTRLVRGQPIGSSIEPPNPTGYAIDPSGQVVAILVHRNGQWWPHKVFARS